jgi:hypothetical protein
MPLPHSEGHGAQSNGQVVQLSVAAQMPSPHWFAHVPQSDGHSAQSSPGLHMPSPHVEHERMHTDATSATHDASQRPTQQNGSTVQICAAHGCSAALIGRPDEHSACGSGEQVPQSDGQVVHASPAAALQM